jgi:cysteine desulfurase/selenocysteine lyase
MLDVAAVRADFPFLQRDPSFAYLDNAASTQKPAAVIEAMNDCYRYHYAPIHRGLYPLAEEASNRYEQARATIARFINAPQAEQLIFTRSATESINLVARGWLQPSLRPDDEVWVTRMEHHANFLPWQAVCHAAGAHLRFIELHEDGTLNLAACEKALFSERVRLIAVTQVSNVLGVINPVEEICRRAAAAGIPVLIDAAQSAGHIPLDVAQLDCNFLVFSAHKMFGPTGIGALYAKAEHLESMEPLLLGGGMVDSVGEEFSTWADYPARFEAGSPNLVGAIGFAAAVDYIQRLGLVTLCEHVERLLQTAHDALRAVPGVRIYSPAETKQKTGIISFNIDGIHPHDLGQIAGEHGVALRAGHHCCQPLMQFLGTAATARVSFAAYNQAADVDALISAIAAAKRVFA